MIHRRRVSNRRRSTVRRPDGAQTAPLLPSRTARPPRLPLTVPRKLPYSPPFIGLPRPVVHRPPRGENRDIPLQRTAAA
jgi:hypothetical protein